MQSIPFLRIAGTVLAFLVTCHAVDTFSSETPEQEAARYGRRARVSLRGGALFRSEADMDTGGSFSSNEFFVQGDLPLSRWFSISLSYRRDEYDFSRTGDFSSLRPWGDVNSLTIDSPARWSLGEGWMAFAVPVLRFTWEGEASLEDSVTGGGIVGAAYRFSDSLTLGPGIGISTEIEDDASIFPILIIRWAINDQLTLETGKGVAASVGPGVFLNWKISDQWAAFVGARYEKLRFRLDDKGPYDNGVGEDRAFPILGGLTWELSEAAEVSVLAGAALAGEFRLEDDGGDLIAEDEYDPAAFIGVSLSLEF